MSDTDDTKRMITSHRFGGVVEWLLATTAVLTLGLLPGLVEWICR